jgi:acetylornithine deacetylase
MKKIFLIIILIIIKVYLCKTKDEIIQLIKTKSNEFQKDSSNIKILQDWIREKSLQNNETSVQLLISNELKKLGFEVDFYHMKHEDLLKSKYYLPSRSDYNNSPNIVGVLKGSNELYIDEFGITKSKSKSIILNGHVDVISLFIKTL